MLIVVFDTQSLTS